MVCYFDQNRIHLRLKSNLTNDIRVRHKIYTLKFHTTNIHILYSGEQMACHTTIITDGIRKSLVKQFQFRYLTHIAIVINDTIISHYSKCKSYKL